MSHQRKAGDNATRGRRLARAASASDKCRRRRSSAPANRRTRPPELTDLLLACHALPARAEHPSAAPDRDRASIGPGPRTPLRHRSGHLPAPVFPRHDHPWTYGSHRFGKCAKPLNRYGVPAARAVARRREGSNETPHYQVHLTDDAGTHYRATVNLESQQAP